MEIKINMTAIVGNKKQNDFMHFADVFERGKILGDILNFTITCEAKDVFDSEFEKTLKSSCEFSRQSFEKSDCIVTYVGINNISFDDDQGHNVILNRTILPYIRPGVQTISNGKEFGLFDNFLKQKHFGYIVQTSQYRHVLGVKFIEE